MRSGAVINAGVLVLCVALASCRTTGPSGTGASAPATPPQSVSAYMQDIRGAQDWCRRAGNLDGYLLLEAELERVRYEDALPPRDRPAVRKLLKEFRASQVVPADR